MVEPTRRLVTLDVRQAFRRGEKPCDLVLPTIASLGADDDLLLISPFEPRPLFAVLAAQGFTPHVECDAEGIWRTLFRRVRALEAASPPLPKDVRGEGPPAA